MDLLSFIGVAIAFGAILGGNWLEGGHLDILANGPAMLIVLGGPSVPCCLQTPCNLFLRCMRMLGMVFLPPPRARGDHQQAGRMEPVARKDGLLGLNVPRRKKRPVRTQGMQLLVDGSEPDDEIRHALEVELDSRERFDLQASKVLEGMGGYSPTIGIIGAVMGLIHDAESSGPVRWLGHRYRVRCPPSTASVWRTCSCRRWQTSLEGLRAAGKSLPRTGHRGPGGDLGR